MIAISQLFVLSTSLQQCRLITNIDTQLLAHNILKVIAAKRMHNFLPHFIYFATLPENTVAIE